MASPKHVLSQMRQFAYSKFCDMVGHSFEEDEDGEMVCVVCGITLEEAREEDE